MNKLLVVNSSPGLSDSHIRVLIDTFTRQFATKIPAAEIIERDLGEHPVPHLDEATIEAFFTAGDKLSHKQKDLLALSDALIAEIKAADVILIGSPMYNYSIPSGLKAWIDQVVRAGHTFRFTAEGPHGLLSGKKLVVITARGGDYSMPPMCQLDYQEPYLRDIFAMIGLTDTDFIHCQGVAMGDDARVRAMAQATAEVIAAVDQLAATNA